MSTPWNVYKFGGSSLASPGRLTRVLTLVHAAPRPLALVVSALGDSTDWLLEAADAAARGEDARAHEALGRVHALALATARPVLGAEALEAYARHVEDALAPVRRLLVGVSLTRECTPAARDEVLALGERLSVELVARALGPEALAVDARELLVTDAAHGRAQVDLAASAPHVAAARVGWEAAGRLPVVTGFTGRSPEGRTTTLGRNGSDYTATLLAQLLPAREVTVWTDVPGVFTADPALVPDAYPVPHMTYAEALELAHFGARNFHARTMVPLRDAGAALRIRSTAEPAAPGTRIDAGGAADAGRPTCVTSLERLALVQVQALSVPPPAGLGARVLAALDAARVPAWSGSLSALGPALTLLVSAGDEGRAHAALAHALAPELARGEVELPPARGPVSQVTLVAEAMGQRPNVAGRLFAALGNVGVNVRAITQGASSRSISCVVDAEDTAAAVRTVHAAFNLHHTDISVVLLGRGTVGSRLLAQLAAHGPALRERHGVALRLVGVADRRRLVFDERGLPPAEASARLDAAGADGERSDVAALLPRLSRLSVPVLVDCTAADGLEVLYGQAFRQGVHVVAANKKPLALPHGVQAALQAEARAHFRAWHYETTVGASLPVIETLKNLVRTGDRVERIEGSLSGTLGYLCGELMAGVPLSRAVRTARERGYTEPHPREDLSGRDVARKGLILARELGLVLDEADVAVEPFVPAGLLAEEDPERFLRALVAYDGEVAAQVERYRKASLALRYLARVEPGAHGPVVRVGPVAVEADHPAVGLKGAEALVAFHTERYREHPLIVRGAGAGGDVTAAGVLADILRLAQNVRGRR